MTEISLYKSRPKDACRLPDHLNCYNLLETNTSYQVPLPSRVPKISHLQYFDYPNFGTRTRKEFGASQTVCIGNFIELPGQGGWNPESEEFPIALSDEIEQAFSNVQLALTTAGGKGWEKVYKVRVYCNLKGQSGWQEYGQYLAMSRKKWCPVSLDESVT